MPAAAKTSDSGFMRKRQLRIIAASFETSPPGAGEIGLIGEQRAAVGRDVLDNAQVAHAGRDLGELLRRSRRVGIQRAGDEQRRARSRGEVASPARRRRPRNSARARRAPAIARRSRCRLRCIASVVPRFRPAMPMCVGATSGCRFSQSTAAWTSRASTAGSRTESNLPTRHALADRSRGRRSPPRAAASAIDIPVGVRAHVGVHQQHRRRRGGLGVHAADSERRRRRREWTPSLRHRRRGDAVHSSDHGDGRRSPRCASRDSSFEHRRDIRAPRAPRPTKIARLISAWPIDTSSTCGTLRKIGQVVRGRGRGRR